MRFGAVFAALALSSAVLATKDEIYGGSKDMGSSADGAVALTTVATSEKPAKTGYKGGNGGSYGKDNGSQKGYGSDEDSYGKKGSSDDGYGKDNGSYNNHDDSGKGKDSYGKDDGSNKGGNGKDDGYNKGGNGKDDGYNSSKGGYGKDEGSYDKSTKGHGDYNDKGHKTTYVYHSQDTTSTDSTSTTTTSSSSEESTEESSISTTVAEESSSYAEYSYNMDVTSTVVETSTEVYMNMYTYVSEITSTTTAEEVSYMSEPPMETVLSSAAMTYVAPTETTTAVYQPAFTLSASSYQAGPTYTSEASPVAETVESSAAPIYQSTYVAPQPPYTTTPPATLASVYATGTVMSLQVPSSAAAQFTGAAAAGARGEYAVAMGGVGVLAALLL